MTRTELDEALLRLQAERDERFATQLQEDARDREKRAREYKKQATSIQNTIRIATVFYAVLTAAILAVAAVQAYGAWKQSHTPSPLPIINNTVVVPKTDK
jgi:cell division septal protein FtsQ